MPDYIAKLKVLIRDKTREIKHASGVSMSVNSAHALYHIFKAKEHLTPTQIAGLIGLEPTSLTPTLDWLENRKLVERNSVPGTKAVFIVPTEEGIKIFNKIKDFIEDYNRLLSTLFNKIR